MRRAVLLHGQLGAGRHTVVRSGLQSGRNMQNRTGASWMAFGFVSLLIYLNYRSKVSNDEFGRDRTYVFGGKFAGIGRRRGFHAFLSLVQAAPRPAQQACG